MNYTFSQHIPHLESMKKYPSTLCYKGNLDLLKRPKGLKLLNENKAKAIHDIESFASRFGKSVDDEVQKDEFFYFCQTSPTFDESLEKYGDRVYKQNLKG